MFSLRFFTIIPEKSAFIIERFGKFHQVKEPGWNWLVPVLDRIAYKQSLKEEAISIEKQQVISKDNVTISIDGVLFVQVDDPYKASYQVERPHEAVKLLCLTILRSEIGKMKLDQLLQERGELNKNLFKAVNQTAQGWGLKCNSVEILQIDPPDEIKKSMQFQASAERLKRRDILISEGNRASEINLAEADKISAILKAEGESESVQLRAEAEAAALKSIGEAIEKTKQNRVTDYILLSSYLKGYKQVLQKSNVVVVPEGKDQEGQKGNDILALAGMLLFSNQQGKYNPIHLQESPQQQKTIDHSIQQKQTLKENPSTSESIQNLIKKNVYYDDISLYSSGDDEGKPKSSNKIQQKI